MLRHIVLFKMADGLDEDDMEIFLNHIRDLRGEIPAISDLAAGVDISNRGSFDIALTVDLHGLSELQAYLEHPAHRRLVDKVVSRFVARREVIDFHLE